MEITQPKRRVLIGRAAGFAFFWSLSILGLEGAIAPFGSLRHSFLVYGIAAPSVALGLVAVGLRTGWLRIEIADQELGSKDVTNRKS